MLRIAGLALQFGLFYYLVNSKEIRKFPFFAIYTIFVATTNPFLFYLKETGHLYYYFYLYYIQDFICILLSLFILYEILIRVFAQFQNIKMLGLRIFTVSVLVMTLIAIGSSISFAEHTVHPDSQIFYRAESALRFIQVGMVLFLMFFMRSLALVWNKQYFSIAFGFGFYAAVALFYFVCKMQYGLNLAPEFGGIFNVGYFGSQILWTIGIMHTSQNQAPVALPNFRHLDKWNRLLSNI